MDIQNNCFLDFEFGLSDSIQYIFKSAIWHSLAYLCSPICILFNSQTSLGWLVFFFFSFLQFDSSYNIENFRGTIYNYNLLRITPIKNAID